MKRAYGLYITIALVAALLLTVYATRHRVHASTYTVTTTADSGAGSLRQAILDANANPGLDTIEFNIGTGTPTIAPTSALPIITDPVIINGNTGGATRVELNGSSAGVGTNGLEITAGGSTVRNIVINRFRASGIVLSTNGGNVIEGNYIGTDATGTASLGNSFSGVILYAPNNTVGGTTAAVRNIISGNSSSGVGIVGEPATGNRVEGNYIGTDVTGAANLGNSTNGVSIFGASNNTIGGTAAEARNVISGNGYGVYFFVASGNKVEGNYIGTNAAGTANLGNSSTGVFISDAPNNTVGGTAAGARNVISGNSGSGVAIDGSAATGNKIEGNYIGTDVTGTVDLGNSNIGVSISGGPTNNTIGGTTAGARNTISGNDSAGVFIGTASGNRVEGNYIGTDASGTADLGNLFGGVAMSATTNNVIGGTTAEARNIISGNDSFGVLIGTATSGCRVEGNYIGTDVTGTVDLGNSGDGVYILGGQSNIIGGTTSGARNLISGNNESGVEIFGTEGGASGNRVEGNYIGTDANGTADLGNSLDGVFINGAPNNIVGGTAAGAGNLIAFNDARGVIVAGSIATGNVIRGNSIHSNTNIGIDLKDDGVTLNDPLAPACPADTDTGPNNLQNYPVITLAGPTVQGFLNSTANTTFTLDFYSSPAPDPSGFGEGQTYLGSTVVTTDATCNASFDVTLMTSLPAGEWITATATDPDGNTSEFSGSQLVTSLPCTLTCPENITESNSAGQCGAVVNYSAPVTSGNCGTVSCAQASGSFFPVGTTTVTCSVAGGPSCSFTVTVNDTQAPTVTCPGNIDATAPPQQTCAVVEYTTPTANDNCTATVNCLPASGTCFALGTTTVTCTATDASQNTGTCSFTITVTQQSCAITCPSNIAQNNDSNQCGAVVTYTTPTPPQGCGAVTCAPASGAFFATGTTTVTCTVAGGPSCAFTVTVNDAQAPTVTCPAHIDATAPPGENCVAVSYTTPAANDNCTATVNCLPASGTCFALGTTTVTCTATDASQNTGNCTFTITVTQQSCAITCPSNIAQNNDSNQCGAVVTYTTPTPPKGCGAVTCAPASGSFFATGTTTVTCSVAGGPSCSFNVTVNDKQAPTVTCPAHIDATAPAGESCVAVSYTTPAANDNCTATVNCLPASGTCFAVGTTTVTCTATDASQNSGSCSFTITVTQQVCTITCPANIAKNNDPDQCGAVATFATPVPPQGCGAVTCAPASGSFFAKGTTTVTCSVAGGPSCSFTVTVNDTQQPSIACPANMSSTAPPGQTCAVVNYTTPTASDNCSGSTVSCAPASGTCFPIGTTTVTCTAMDASKNPGGCSFTVTVAPPCMITCPSNITKNNDPDQCGAVVTYPAPTTSGGCGTVNCSPASGSFFPKGATTVTCTTTAGPSCSFTVTVNDIQPPAIACPASINIAAEATCPPTSSKSVSFSATATDNCPGVNVVCSPASGSMFPVGTTSVTCTATDSSGITARCSFGVSVFSACLVDQSNTGNVVLFNTVTGEYRFCCSGVLLATGTGVLTIRGCIGTIDHQKGDRKVHIGFDFSANNGHGAGTAALFLGGSTNPKCSITDQSMAGNACACPSAPLQPEHK